MKEIERIKNKLLSAERAIPFSSKSWIEGVPSKAGVYVIWSKRGNKSALYVGETSSLFERFKDLGSWRNHTFSRKIKNKYDLCTPAEVRLKITAMFQISFCEVEFGRKEIEEYLIYEWNTHAKFNKKSPRYERAQSQT